MGRIFKFFFMTYCFTFNWLCSIVEGKDNSLFIFRKTFSFFSVPEVGIEWVLIGSAMRRSEMIKVFCF